MITIYYASLDNKLELEEPVNIIKNYTKKQNKEFTHCPAWLNQNKNVYGIKSTQNFNLTARDGIFESDQPQEWFDNNILVRDGNTFSFEQNVFFFTLEKSLMLEQKTPVLENNDIKTKTHLVEGIFDIGKWIRPLECAVVMNKDDTLNINQDDIIYYIKFHTKEKIRFKKFLITSELIHSLTVCGKTRKNRHLKILKPLKYFYNLVDAKKLKKIIYREIKKNLI